MVNSIQNGAVGGSRLRSLATAFRRAYAGLLPAIVRAGPANAVSMSCYEWAKSYSRKKQQVHNDRMKKAAPDA